MAKTEKELQELKAKWEEINRELGELSEEELRQVAGGVENFPIPDDTKGQNQWYWHNNYGADVP